MDILINKFKEFGEVRYRISFQTNNFDYDFVYQNTDINKPRIINDIIRARYSQADVEAIINNHFLNISEWLDSKLSGEEVIFEDADYQELQEWRALAKEIANYVIDNYKNVE